MNRDEYDDLMRAVRWLTWALFFLAVAVACATIRAAEAAIGEPVATSADAVGWALGDVAAIPEQDRPFVRYVWIPPWGNPEWLARLDFAVNTAASHAATIQLGVPIANGWMLRYDLRRLAPAQAQFDALRTTWDGLAAQDPYFHVPAVNTGLAAAVIAPHLSPEQASALAGLTLSTGAIYRADFLLVKMLSAIEGGKYYEFLQIPRTITEAERKAGLTPQAKWLATLGVFERTTQELQADQRAAIFRSLVTGKPRRIDVLFGLGRGGNLATITHDVADEDVAAGQHPIRNLLAFQDRARELIVQRPNGTHAFALTDNRGEFQATAPDNVARDHTVPAPHTARLQPAISCIRCHGPHDGYQPFGNDVNAILSGRLDVFADVGSGGGREAVIDRLAGLYAGQLDTPDGPIGRARRDYSATLYRIAGAGAFGPPPADIVSGLSAGVAAIYGAYRHDAVTAETACLELGLRVEPGQGLAGLAQLLGDPHGVAVDPVAGSLRAGIAVNRADWETVYGDLAVQVEARRK